ncbi:MAG: HNH endonuclease [Methanoregula sp.]|nr:HNH endonuclease [Methanoregula sp.]
MHANNQVSPSPDPDDDTFDEDFHSLSWSIEPGPIAIKKTDRPFFLYRETVIPQKVQDFFSIEDLQPGNKRGIVFWLDDQPFEAFIEKTHHLPPRTRMMWKQDFAEIIHTACPQWLEFFKKNKGDESNDTPSIFFIRRHHPHHYDVAFEGALSPGATPAEFHVPLKPGDTIDNETLRAIFSCGPEGNIRRSLKTSSIVLVSDHTRSPYEDTWVNNFFHYTGRGLGGKQALSLPENKALVESKAHGVSLYLFEVFAEGHYVYMGEVELSDRPFLSRQTDSEKNIRDVYIFPLKLVGQKRPPLHYRDLGATKEELARRNAQRSALSAPGVLVPYAMKGRRIHDASSLNPRQEPLVPANTQQPVGGHCQLCNQPAPFCTRNGEPYLETHHIHWLSKGGKDVMENTVVLCPNCHRKMHVLNLPADVARLKNLFLSGG